MVRNGKKHRHRIVGIKKNIGIASLSKIDHRSSLYVILLFDLDIPINSFARYMVCFGAKRCLKRSSWIWNCGWQPYTTGPFIYLCQIILCWAVVFWRRSFLAQFVLLLLRSSFLSWKQLTDPSSQWGAHAHTIPHTNLLSFTRIERTSLSWSDTDSNCCQILLWGQFVF